MEDPIFEEFQHLTRFAKEHVIVTEKIDGTNAQIFIDDLGQTIKAGSRNRWISTSDDNFGFARWVDEHREDLLRLGPGRHFGEWYGSGIQRGYGLKEKRFALFNTTRWETREGNPNVRPDCCSVVPVLGHLSLDSLDVMEVMRNLERNGSFAVPGWMKPEGIVIYMPNNKSGYKMTFEGDKHKWELNK